MTVKLCPHWWLTCPLSQRGHNKHPVQRESPDESFLLNFAYKSILLTKVWHTDSHNLNSILYMQMWHKAHTEFRNPHFMPIHLTRTHEPSDLLSSTKGQSPVRGYLQNKPEVQWIVSSTRRLQIIFMTSTKSRIHQPQMIVLTCGSPRLWSPSSTYAALAKAKRMAVLKWTSS